LKKRAGVRFRDEIFFKRDKHDNSKFQNFSLTDIYLVDNYKEYNYV